MFGVSITTIYLTILIVIGCITVLYLFFSDMADVSVEAVPFLDPAIILSFITFTSAVGYILEKFSNLSSTIIIILALVVGIILSVFLYFFLLVPLRSAEVSLAYTDSSLEGQIGKVIVPIPIGGFWEIVIESINGVINKRAVSYHGDDIHYDTEVLIIEMRDGTAYVVKYNEEPTIL